MKHILTKFQKIASVFLLLNLGIAFLFADIPTEEDFTIIVLPDTQYYCKYFLDEFKKQTEWIAANRETLNIRYVAHVGDVVEHAAYDDEWDWAEQALSVLEDPAATGLADGIPYGMSPGNHDVPTGDENPLFDINRFSGRDYFGGAYDDNINNSYNYFTAGDTNYIVLNLSFVLQSDVLDWANEVLGDHPTHKAIVVSHSIMNSGTGASFTTNGSTLYNALKGNSNLFLMLAGHIHGEGRRTDIYKGNIVHTLLADYQMGKNGGNGWLRILTFSPAQKQIRVRTYSPSLDQFKTEDGSYFTLDYDPALAVWHCNESTGLSLAAD
jgi:hypothetical protein